jgi:hypothetical protein
LKGLSFENDRFDYDLMAFLEHAIPELKWPAVLAKVVLAARGNTGGNQRDLSSPTTQFEDEEDEMRQVTLRHSLLIGGSLDGNASMVRLTGRWNWRGP